jgi:hypothetical protein
LTDPKVRRITAWSTARFKTGKEVIEQLKITGKITYHWEAEGWLKMKYLGVCKKGHPYIKTGMLLFQSYDQGQPLANVDHADKNQLLKDFGKSSYYGWHFGWAGEA